MKSIRNYAFGLLALASLGVPSASAGGLLIPIDKLQQAGGSGWFEVILTNTESLGGATYNVAGSRSSCSPRLDRG